MHGHLLAALLPSFSEAAVFASPLRLFRCCFCRVWYFRGLFAGCLVRCSEQSASGAAVRAWLSDGSLSSCLLLYGTVLLLRLLCLQPLIQGQFAELICALACDIVC